MRFFDFLRMTTWGFTAQGTGFRIKCGMTAKEKRVVSQVTPPAQ
jgi:hypothetical protein